MTDCIIYILAWVIGTTAGITIGLLIVMAWDKIDMKRLLRRTMEAKAFFRRKN